MFRKEVKRLLVVLLIMALTGGMLPGWDYSIKIYAGYTPYGDWSSSEYITEPALSGNIYTIDSAGDLAWVASQVNSSSNTFSGYTINVTADIDLSDHYWIPIGRTSSIAFKGTFNGNDKVISGLTIGSSASPNSTIKNNGLFGFVNSGTITGVNLDNAAIYSSISSPYAAGLVGEVKGTTAISDCSVTGLFYFSGTGGRIGGILGNYDDYSAGRLTVTNCFSQCAIYSPQVSYAGGIIGYAFSNPSRKTNIRNCYATGSITGGGYMNTSVGGFIGSCQYAGIYNCFSNCTVDGKSCDTGGFAGLIYNSSLSNVYAAGLVKNVYTEGGVIGKNSYPNTNPMSNCYWNSTVNSETTTYGVGNTASNGYTIALSEDYMQSSDFLSDLNDNAAALVAAGNADILSWELDTNKNGGFPRLSGVGAFTEIYKPAAVGVSLSGTVRVKEAVTLNYDYLDYNGYPESGSTIRWYRSANADGSGAEQIPGAGGKTYVLTEADLSKYIYADVTPSNGYTEGNTANSNCTSQVDVPYFSGGSGVEGNPYIIENLTQLKNVTLFPNAHYRLENDITGLDEVLCDSYVGKGPFNGDFNGNGHTVTIDITDSTGSYLGMFSVIESSGKVHDLNINGSISGSKNIGSLAGLNKGEISNCNSSTAVAATGSSVASIYVGGLVASNMGRIADCDVAGTLTASGLTGTGTASSRAVIGGITGENFCLISEGMITGCYTDVAPFSIDVSDFREVYAGGLVGNNYAGGSIENSHVEKGLACSLTTGDAASVVRAGGIAGYNYYAEILQCYATGDITAGGRCALYAGGIAGQCSNGPINQPSTISECYYVGTASANGESTKDTCVGGLVGYFASGNVSYCYSAGGVAGNGGSTGMGNVYTGGLIGYGDNGVMRHCYSRSAGTAEGGSTAYNGGLYGGRKGTYGPYISDCYWNSDNTSATYGDGKNETSWDVGTVLRTTNMTGTQASSDMMQLDFETPYFVTRDNHGESWYYPQLRVFAYNTDNTVSGSSLESVTEAVYSASISPNTVSFDLSSPEDVLVAVSWNNATAISDIKAGGISIGTGSYSVDGDKKLLTIAQDYLEKQHLGVLSLTIEFNKGYPAVLNISIDRSIPSITVSPADRAVTEGETASFEVTAIGDEPLSYQWLKNGSSLSDGGRMSGVKTEKLTISSVQKEDEGSYTCLVSNNTGNVESSAAALTVNPPPAAPYITTHPSSLEVNYWETATFTVEASGGTPMTYQWLKNGNGISDGGRISGASTKTLAITDTQASDGGVYTCRISNEAGDVTSNEATLEVNLINATINPSKVAFDLDNPTDVSTVISWGSARTVTDVVYGSDAASAIYGMDENTLTIRKDFLESLKLTENAVKDFEIIFDLGDSKTLAVEAVRNYIPGSDATLSDLAVGGITVSGFAPDQYEYYVELPSGTKPGSAAAQVSAVLADPKAKLVSITQASALPGDAEVTVNSEDNSMTNTYTIHFTLAEPIPTYALIITAGAGGSITTGSSGSYAAGTLISIAAAPSANYSFNRWTSTGGGTFGSTINTATTYTMPANAATITASFTHNGDGSGGSGSSGNSGGRESSTTSAPSKPTSVYTADVISANIEGSGITKTTLPVTFNTNTGNAAIDIDSQQGNIVTAGENKVIKMPSIPGAVSYTLGIPVDYLSMSDGDGSLTFGTDIGSILLPADMLASFAGEEGSKAEITIAKGDKSGLSDAAKAAIGDRPFIQLEVMIDGKQIEWNNPNAPVTLAIPYEPTVSELANPESIVIWYIDGSGKAVSVPNGHYDPATGMVTFITTHFSAYAVVYNNVSFSDVATGAWYKKAVGFIAARNITTGTDSGKYSPDAKLTRGEFIVMLLKAYSISPDANRSDNFTDAGNTYYTGYLAAAKRLGITEGVGKNMFAPEKEITRQEMFTLLYNALKVIGGLPRGNDRKTLSAFSDADNIASWAKDAMTLFVETGTISGNGGRLYPEGTATRAEMAQILYNLLAK